MLDREWLEQLDSVAERLGLALAPARLAAELRALSEAYNSGDFARSRTRGALSARLLFSFPRDVPKMGAAVRELVATGALALPHDRPLRVLDVGAGLGASTWGLARALAGVGQRGAIHATLVDEDATALGVARAIGERREGEGEVRVRLEASGSDRGRFDVILLGQVLSEMAGDDAAHALRVRRWLDGSLEPGGSLVIVEPALRDRTRKLHRVRDLVVASGATVFAPCLHAAPCPALATEDAWCHEDLPIDLPQELAALARGAGLRWQGLTFAYLVLRKDGRTLRSAIPGAGAVRVVSSPIDTKGKRELFLCGDFAQAGGLVPLRRKIARLDRDAARKGEPDAWRDAERGDVLVCEPPLQADAARATKEVSLSKASF